MYPSSSLGEIEMDFTVKTGQLNRDALMLSGYTAQLRSIENSIDAVRRTLSWKIDSSGSYSNRLRRLSSEVGDCKKTIGNMKSGLQQTVQNYLNTEAVLSSGKQNSCQIVQ